MLKLALLAVGFGFLAIIAFSVRYLGPYSFTKEQQIDRGVFYRIKVEVQYKGQQSDLDVVVGCNVRTTLYKDSDRSVELGIFPFVYGIRLFDGKALVIRPPDACSGETTADGLVPKEFLPLLIVYNNAERPTEGLGYATDDAYNNASSELSFQSATILAATKQEWDNWLRQEAPKNIVKREMMSSNVGDPFRHPPWKNGTVLFGQRCRGVLRLPIPTSIQQVLEQHWPDEKPRFWLPDEATRKLFLKIVAPRQAPSAPSFEGNDFWDYPQDSKGLATHGMPRRNVNAMIFFKRRAGDVFPVQTDLTLANVQNDGTLSATIAHKPLLNESEAKVSAAWKGYLLCVSDPEVSYVGTPRVRPSGGNFYRSVNGVVITENPQTRPNYGTRSYFFFEGTDYIYTDIQFDLATIFGGI